MGRRPAQSDAKLDAPRPKPMKKDRLKAIPIPDPLEMEEPRCSKDVIVPRKGMVFKSFEEVCEFYNRYAQHLGFATKIRSSSHKRSYIEIMCWKGRQRDKRRLGALAPRPTLYTSCPAILKVGISNLDGMYRLKEVILEHNHELNPLRMHFFRDGNMLSAGVKKRARKDSADVDAAAARDMDSAVHETGWAASAGELYRLKLAKEDIKAINLFFCHMQTGNSNFFYLMDMDDECRPKNVFWADGRSRSACRHFGDVILLDTSYLRSKFNVPLVTFVGVNHHGQSVLMGCCLLSDGSTSSYLWLFRAWLSCMSGHAPHAIITDQGNAVQEAVMKVFPGCSHRLCLGQILKRIPEKLEGCTAYKDIKRSFKRTVFDSLRPFEFGMEWRNMVEKYHLIYNEWLRVLYEDRHHWAPAFVKDTFWAGMSITRHDDNMESVFEGHIDTCTSVKEFLDQYEVIMETKYESEALADFESYHKVPPLFTEFYMEQQLSEIYTVNMFAKFQDEVKALVYCHPLLVKTDGSVLTFEVREHVRVKESKVMEQKNYEVVFRADTQEVQCICCCFETRGILCRHVLSVFNFQDLDEIPCRYIIERWRRDFKGLQAATYPLYEMVANGPMERYENLYKRCLKLADAGTMSDDKYEFSLRVINEAMSKLLEENFKYKGKMVKIMVIKPTTDRNDITTSHVNQNVGGESDEVQHLTEQGQNAKENMSKAPMSEEASDNNRAKEQANSQDPTAILHTMVPMAFQQTVTPTSFNPWNFPPMSQIRPSNLFYYAATPANHSQLGLLLEKEHVGLNRVSTQSGDLWSSQQTLQRTSKTERPPGPKRKRQKSNLTSTEK